MGSMQITRSYIVNKNNVLSEVARSASCSRGWLRLVVQTTFAVISVASFILIIIMSMRSTSLIPGNNGRPSTRCDVSSCKVMCRNAPDFGRHESDILNAVSEAETKCKWISLTLTNPRFVNSSLPVKWLSELRSNIYELCIFRGNLVTIPQDAFMTSFARSIKILQFQSVTIRFLEPNSLVGLSSLQELHIKNSNITRIRKGALRAVDDTLKTLSITESRRWNPAKITGTTHFETLATVDFSSNNFQDMLTSRSFTGLENCKVLYLNSCRITSIGAGAFDHLLNIDVIYLNNNLLVSFVPGLFDVLMTLNPRPRISLQDNSWHCNCSEDLKMLVSKELLLVEPICYYPTEYKGKTFSEFAASCDSSFRSTSLLEINNFFENLRAEDNSDYIQVNGSCSIDYSVSRNISLRLLSPMQRYECSADRVDRVDNLNAQVGGTSILSRNSWLKLTFFLKTDTYSVVQIDSSAAGGYGLLWYQSSCPDEVYCVNILPNFLRIYNIDFSARYTFCPVILSTGYVDIDNCVGFDIKSFDVDSEYSSFVNIMLYIVTALVCLIFGALCVYGLIRANPTLLKGSKRILFVKHKMVDALVLPPKVPLRNDVVNETSPNTDNKKIFIVSSASNLSPARLNTQKSIRSNRSSNPSYVSALQPTDDQLAEWRIQHHFNNDLTITSMNSDVSLFSWVCTGSTPYYSLDTDSNRTYESLN